MKQSKDDTTMMYSKEPERSKLTSHLKQVNGSPERTGPQAITENQAGVVEDDPQVQEIKDFSLNTGKRP